MQLQMLCYKLLKKIFITGLLIVVTVPHDSSKRYILSLVYKPNRENGSPKQERMSRQEAKHCNGG